MPNQDRDAILYIAENEKFFNGAGSYDYSVSTKACMIDCYTQNEASEANTYGKSRAYQNNYSCIIIILIEVIIIAALRRRL